MYTQTRFKLNSDASSAVSTRNFGSARGIMVPVITAAVAVVMTLTPGTAHAAPY